MKIVVILTISIFLFTACIKNNLHVCNASALFSATFWRIGQDGKGATVGVYSAWAGSHNYQVYFADDWSDDARPTGFWHFFDYYSWGVGNISPQDANINNYWAALYSVIRN